MSKINSSDQNLILQAKYIVQDYSEDDIKLCISVLNEEERQRLSTYIINYIQENKKWLTNQQYYNAIATIIDLEELRKNKK